MPELSSARSAAARRGPQLGTVLRRIMLLAVLLVAGCVALLYWRMEIDRRIEAGQAVRVDGIKAAHEMLGRSGALTGLARLYAATGNAIYLRYYEIEDAMRDGRAPVPPEYSPVFWNRVLAGELRLSPFGETESFHDRIRRLKLAPGEIALLDAADAASRELMTIERRVLEEIRSRPEGVPDPWVATPLYDDAYLAGKGRVVAPVGEFLEALQVRTQAELAGLRRLQHRLSDALFVGVCLLGLVVVTVVWVVRHRVLGPLTGLLARATGRAEDAAAAGPAGQALPGIEEVRRLAAEVEQMVVELERLAQDREQLVRALQVSEDRFRRVAEHMPGVVFECRLDPVLQLPHFSYLSSRLERILGVGVQALRADPMLLEQYLSPPDLARLKSAVGGALATGGDLDLVLRLQVPSRPPWCFRLQAHQIDPRPGRHGYAGLLSEVPDTPEPPRPPARVSV